MGSLVALLLATIAGTQPTLASDGPTLADLDHLVALYKNLRLPMPPKSAKLVTTGGIHRGYDSISGAHSFVDCGYLIRKLPHTRARLMIGTRVVDQFYQDGLSIKLTMAGATSISPDAYAVGAPFSEDFGLSLAAIEGARGHKDFALAALRKSRRVGRGLYVAAYPRPQSYDGRMLQLALAHWFNVLVTPHSDRALVLAELEALDKRSPTLLNDEGKEVIADLRQTISKRYAGNDRVERLIEGLRDVQTDGMRFSSPDPLGKDKFHALQELVSFGYEAIPKLIQHLDDNRLTRSTGGPGQVSILRLVAVGEVCTNLAEQFSTLRSENWIPLSERKELLRKWWASAAKKDERKNCLERLMQHDEHFSEAPILWATKRSPDLLLLAYDDILHGSKKTQTYGLLEGMEASTLKRQVIIDAASRGLIAKDLSQVNASIWTLYRLDKVRFDSAILEVLPELPKGVSDEVNRFGVTSFAYQASLSNSEKVWGALTKAIQDNRDALGFNMIEETSHVERRGMNRKLWLNFLVQIFERSELSNANITSSYDSFWVDEGRELATKIAANELGVKDIPNQGSTPSQWDDFRLRLKALIAKH